MPGTWVFAVYKVLFTEKNHDFVYKIRKKKLTLMKKLRQYVFS